jgi:Tfp pilus assembly protein FimT
VQIGNYIFVNQMNQKGITLIELVVVFVIIAIGAVLLAPKIGAWLPNYRLRSATRDIASTLRTAQAKAVSNNFQYRVNLNIGDVGTNSYVLQRNTGGVWVNDGVIQGLPAGITIVENTFNNQRAEFNPNSTSTAGSLTLQNTRGTQRRITLTSATGRVRIE